MAEYEDELDDDETIEDPSNVTDDPDQNTDKQAQNPKSQQHQAQQKDTNRTANWARNQVKKRLGAKNITKTAVKQGAKQGAKRATQAALSSTGVGTVAAVAIEAVTNARIRKIAIWTVLGIIIAFILFFAKDDTLTTVNEEILQEGQTQTGTGTSGIPGLTSLNKTGPAQVSNGDVIEYQITANYTGTADVTITDTVPTNTEFLTCISCERNGNNLSWKLKSGANSFSFTVRPTANDIVVINTIQARAGVGGNVGACQFYRGSAPPQSYKSPQLVSYFDEAERLSGVPAVILAAIARVESPDAVNLTDQTLPNFKCAESPTGALGLMQIQPPPRINPRDSGAYYEDGMRLGASYLGKTPDQLTREDFCDPKTSVILASGFVIRKTRALLGQSGDTWDPSWNTNKDVLATVARGYYGALNYDGGNYGEDLYASVLSCKGPGLARKGLGPVPPPPSDIRQAIRENFNMTFDSFNNEELTWAWNFLWNTSNTGLIDLTQGITVDRSPQPTLSYMNGCAKGKPNINLATFTTEESFDFSFAHELGHYIYDCADPNKKLTAKHQTAFEEGAISRYAQNPASCTVGQTIEGQRPRAIAVEEDYADMIAYYLNPTVGEIGNCLASLSNPTANPFFGNNSAKFPKHQEVVKQILDIKEP